MQKRAVAYYRVSRGWTHRRGPEIEDQERACQAFARRSGYRIFEEFVEVEYGKGADSLDRRPELRRCLEMAARLDMPVIVLRLDRITRNVNFLAQLLGDVSFLVTGPNGADGSFLGPRPAMPRSQRAKIARGTKAALARRRQQGAPLGNTTNLAEAGGAGRRAIAERADRFAGRIAPIIGEIRSKGPESLRGVADELNRRQVPSARGGKWTATMVRRVIDRHAASARPASR